MVKNEPANAKGDGDTGSIPGLGRSPGGENGNPLQDSCLENLMTALLQNQKKKKKKSMEPESPNKATLDFLKP